MLPLRYPALWSLLGWLLVVSVIVGSLVPAPLIQAVSLNDKILHAATYGFLMVWFSGLYRRGFYVAIAAVLLGLGIALDVLQGFTRTRSFSMPDIAADLAGIVVGCVLAFSLVGGWCQRLERRLLS